MEPRRLLATIDLSSTPGTTTNAPLGVALTGTNSNNFAGYTVTDVGNVTGSGFDSFVVSATGLPPAGIGGLPNLTTAGESAAYLVFGSKQVNVTNAVDWLTLATATTNATGQLVSGTRGGDLGELGTTGVATALNPAPVTAQTNPLVTQPLPQTNANHVYGFNFDGLTLVTGLDTATGMGRNSALGYSVQPLGDLNGDGFDDFAISAPNDAGGGKVFIIYGGAALATQGITSKTVDLEPTPGTSPPTTPTKVVSLSLLGAGAGTDVGYSVAGIGNYFNTTNARDVAIGVPGLTVANLANAGAVFAISGTYLNTLATGTNVDLNTIGNGTNTTAGIEYTGTVANAFTGFSVSTAGNFDGLIGSNSPLDDLLIGAPGAAFGGQAYLVYASQNFLPNTTLGTTQSLATLGVAATTNPVTNPLQGVVFSAQNSGADLGYAVSSAGDFNSDGVGDILLGAPGYNGDTGFADVIYGTAGTSALTPASRINGTFTITPTAASTGLTATSFVGQTLGDLTGYALAVTTHIVFGTVTGTTPLYDILVGAPGATNFGGEVYLVPGTANGATALPLPQMLSNINSSLNGTLFNVSGTSDPSINNGLGGIGGSISVRNPIIDANTRGTTVDNDAIPDLFFGAPQSGLNNSTITNGVRPNSGVAYVVEGSLIGGTSTTTPTTPTTGTTGNIVTTPLAASILAPPIFTGDLAGLPYPPVSSLEHLTSYQPLPVPIAYEQFLPAQGFLAREQVYHHPSQNKRAHQAPLGSELNVSAIGHSENKYLRYNSLLSKVFDRGKFKIGKAVTWTHKQRVIPRSEQTQSYPG